VCGVLCLFRPAVGARGKAERCVVLFLRSCSWVLYLELWCSSFPTRPGCQGRGSDSRGWQTNGVRFSLKELFSGGFTTVCSVVPSRLNGCRTTAPFCLARVVPEFLPPLQVVVFSSGDAVAVLGDFVRIREKKLEGSDCVLI
jgi:hypothetical protein